MDKQTTHKSTQTQPYLLIDVDVTGVDAVSEKVLCTAVAATQVAIVEQLPAQTHIDTAEIHKLKRRDLLGIDPGENQLVLSECLHMWNKLCSVLR